MDRELTPEQRAFQLAVRDFAEDVVGPAAAARAAAGGFAEDVVRRMGELGLFGIPFPSRYGGLDGGLLTFCVCLEELGRVDVSVALTLAWAVCGGANAIHRLGDDEQRRRWLVPMARGRSVGALATPPEGPADGVTVRLEEDAWVLDGVACPVAVVATPLTEVCVVAAREAGADKITPIVVPVLTAGLSLDPLREEAGRGEGTGAVALEGCRVPLDHLLGERGGGDPQLRAVLADARVAEAAVAAGSAGARSGYTGDVDAVRSAYRVAARLLDRGHAAGTEVAAAGLLADRIWGS